MIKRLFIFLLLLSICSIGWCAVNFDGSNDFLDIGTMGTFGSTMDTEGFQFSCWLESSTTDAIMALCGTVNTGSNTFVQVVVNAGSSDTLNAGYIGIAMRDEDAQLYLAGVDSNTGITDGNPHHLWVFIDGNSNGSSRIYLDGNLQTRTDNVTAVVDNTTNFGFAMYIGARN